MTRRDGAARSMILLRLLLGGVIISFPGPMVRLAHTGPTMTAFYRMLSGGLILSAIVLVQRKRLWQGMHSFLLAAACGAVFAADLSLWHRSILYVGPGLATMLVNFQVFFLAGFGILVLKERLSFRLAAAILFSVGGLVLIVHSDPTRITAHYRTGVLFALIAAVCYTTYLIVLRRLQTRTDIGVTMANIAVVSLTSAVILGGEALFQHESFVIPDLQTVVLLVGLGIIGQVVAWVVISRSLPKVPASLAGLVLLLQPVLTSVWDVLFFRRPVTANVGIGAALALVGIYLGTSTAAGSKLD